MVMASGSSGAHLRTTVSHYPLVQDSHAHPGRCLRAQGPVKEALGVKIARDRHRRPMFESERKRRIPIGAELLPGGGVGFRVWAPLHKRVEVVCEDPESARSGNASTAVLLEPESGGYFSGIVRTA